MKLKVMGYFRIAAALLVLLFVASAFIGCADDEKVVGIAWREDVDSEFYTNVVAAVKAAGGTPVLLNQVVAEYLTYDKAGKLIGCADDVGAMTTTAADKIKENSWKNSNVEAVMSGIDAVIFTGGEDISPTLLREPEPRYGNEAEFDYNVTRDASDYILMSYCIENDIAAVGFCRGMQMLAVVSGASIIQDIPTYFEGIGKDYHYEHRNEKETPDSYRDYVPHEVDITSGSLASEIFGTNILDGCPSWHHQAVFSVENTKLRVTGSTNTNSVNMIEIIEHTGKGFIMGFQFHPEAATVKHLNGAKNASDFMSYETSLLVFEALLNHIK